MLRVLRWLFTLIVVVAVVIVGGAVLLPSTVVVSRSIDIAAPPEKVFAIVGDLKRFNEFSPWVDLDPNTQYAFEGPEQGVGQTMRWTSADQDVGSGSQTVTEHTPPTRFATNLDFGQMGKADATWDIAASGEGSKVTWGFSSQTEGIFGRWMGLMFDRWIGADYEKGLARLKVIAEAPVVDAPADDAPAEPGAAPAEPAEPVEPLPAEPADPATPAAP